MSFKFTNFVIPEQRFNVSEAIIKATCGSWKNMCGTFCMNIELSIYPTTESSRTMDAFYKYSLEKFVINAGSMLPDEYVNGLPIESWHRIKSDMLKSIYTELISVYPDIFGKAEEA